MFRLFTLALAALFATTALADDKKPGEPITAIAVEKDDKIEIKAKPTQPTKVTSSEELEKLIPDEATRKRIAKLIDFKTHTLLVFGWQGSGQDKIDYVIQESFPEQIGFSYKPGRTKDLRSHVRIYSVRNNVKWSVK
jgi:hypothetical protein